MSDCTVGWHNRSWEHILNAPKAENGPTETQHQKFIDEKKPNFIGRSTPAQTFSLGATLLFGLSFLFNFNSDNDFTKWGSGILAGASAAATAFFGLAKGWKTESTENKKKPTPPPNNPKPTKTRKAAPSNPTPKPGKIFAEKDFYSRLNYSDMTGNDIAPEENTKKYARALAETANKVGIDEINNVANDIRSKFDILVGRLDIEPSIYGQSESWIIWDIGKQIYLNENPDESSDKYRLANPLTDAQLQEEIIYRHIGWEIEYEKGTAHDLSSHELVEIGREAVEKAE